MNRLEELQRKSDDIAQETQALNRSLDLIRQGSIERTRVDGSGHCRWPADTAPSHTSTGPILWDGVNHADVPIGDTLYAGPLAKDNGPGNAPSDMDISTAMDNVPSFYRSGTKHYRCCGREIKGDSDMRRHLRTGLKHSLPQFACACGRTYTRKDARTSHEKKCRKKLEAPDALLT